MAKKADPELLAQICAESERTEDDPYPPGAAFTRPNREQSRSAARTRAPSATGEG